MKGQRCKIKSTWNHEHTTGKVDGNKDRGRCNSQDNLHRSRTSVGTYYSSSDKHTSLLLSLLSLTHPAPRTCSGQFLARGYYGFSHLGTCPMKPGPLDAQSKNVTGPTQMHIRGSCDKASAGVKKKPKQGEKESPKKKGEERV